MLYQSVQEGAILGLDLEGGSAPIIMTCTDFLAINISGIFCL